MLIGNKSDLIEKRQIFQEEGEKMAKENNMFFCETSARENYNNLVITAFETVIHGKNVIVTL